MESFLVQASQLGDHTVLYFKNSFNCFVMKPIRFESISELIF